MEIVFISIGEQIVSDGLLLTCRESSGGCIGYSRINTSDCDRFLCSSVHRSDFKSVIFVESASQIIAGKLVEQVANEGCGKCAFADMDESNEPCRSCTGKTMYKQVKRNN